MSIKIRPPQRDETIAALQRARVNADVLHRRRGVALKNLSVAQFRNITDTHDGVLVTGSDGNGSSAS